LTPLQHPCPHDADMASLAALAGILATTLLLLGAITGLDRL
jgi:hypothetical protein